jgi:hypothetical protein
MLKRCRVSPCATAGGWSRGRRRGTACTHAWRRSAGRRPRRSRRGISSERTAPAASFAGSRAGCRALRPRSDPPRRRRCTSLHAGRGPGTTRRSRTPSTSGGSSQRSSSGQAPRGCCAATSSSAGPRPFATRATRVTSPGGRAPHLWLPDGRSLFDMFGFEWTLLRLGASPPTGDRLIRAAGQLNVGLAVVDVVAVEARDLYEAPLALIRPDQVVAWRGFDDGNAAEVSRSSRGVPHPPDHASVHPSTPSTGPCRSTSRARRRLSAPSASTRGLADILVRVD